VEEMSQEDKKLQRVKSVGSDGGSNIAANEKTVLSPTCGWFVSEFFKCLWAGKAGAA
jgi:hypothetical protein